MQCLIFFFQMHENVSLVNVGEGGGSEFIGNQGVQLEKLQWFGWS